MPPEAFSTVLKSINDVGARTTADKKQEKVHGCGKYITEREQIIWEKKCLKTAGYYVVWQAI